METVPPEVTSRSFFRSHKVPYLVFLLCSIGIIFYYVTSAPPDNQSRANRQPTTIHVAEGESLGAITTELEDKRIVRYGSLLKVFLKVLRLDTEIERGDYRFDVSMPVWQVAWMLARGDHRVDPIKITFKEGITNDQMATLLSEKLSAFRRDLFLSDSRAKQGYLFPDTYFFFSLTTSSEIVHEISQNFINHMNPLEKDISKSGHTKDDIIIMASLIEKEAAGTEDAPIISGILWKRIRLGIPLQADAAKETYLSTGLPKNAIANPGESSISASLHPTDSPYLFYLHGKDGRVHFAKTFAEHRTNIIRYLK